jgi:hypothetical protein
MQAAWLDAPLTPPSCSPPVAGTQGEATPGVGAQTAPQAV